MLHIRPPETLLTAPRAPLRLRRKVKSRISQRTTRQVVDTRLEAARAAWQRRHYLLHPTHGERLSKQATERLQRHALHASLKRHPSTSSLNARRHPQRKARRPALPPSNDASARSRRYASAARTRYSITTKLTTSHSVPPAYFNRRHHAQIRKPHEDHARPSGR